MALVICACLTLPTVPCSFQRRNPGWEACLAQSLMTTEGPTSLPLTGPASPCCPGTPSCTLPGLGISSEVGRGRSGLVPSPACCLFSGRLWVRAEIPPGRGWGGVRPWPRPGQRVEASISLHTVSSSVLSPLSQALPYLPQIVRSSPGHHIPWRPVRTKRRLGGEREKPSVLSAESLCCFKRLLCCVSMLI